MPGVAVNDAEAVGGKCIEVFGGLVEAGDRHRGRRAFGPRVCIGWRSGVNVWRPIDHSGRLGPVRRGWR